MKKRAILIAGLVLVALIACCAAAAAVYSAKHEYAVSIVTTQEAEMESGEEVMQEVYALSGEVVETAQDYFVIADAQQGDVQVNFSEETVFDGTSADAIKVGAYVFVDYNGQMTRSLPPQASALRVSLYVVSGVIEETAEDSVTIKQDETGEQLVIHLPESVPELAVGTRIEAYTNGATTMSLPPQTSAAKIVVVLE